jgi:hypothetical protein
LDSLSQKDKFVKNIIVPKIFEYLGILIFFYSNEHEPIHVHGKSDRFESKAEFYIVDGKIVEIKIKPIKGSRPLTGGKYKGQMKIVKEYNDFHEELIEIESAKYIGDFAIRVFFNDGTNRLVDFKPFLESSFHPSIRKYLDESKFLAFTIVDGNLNWNDYDLIFPIDNLYEGKL